MLMKVLKVIDMYSLIHSFIYSRTRLQYAKNRPEFFALKGSHSN